MCSNNGDLRGESLCMWRIVGALVAQINFIADYNVGKYHRARAFCVLSLCSVVHNKV